MEAKNETESLNCPACQKCTTSAPCPPTPFCTPCTTPVPQELGTVDIFKTFSLIKNENISSCYQVHNVFLQQYYANNAKKHLLLVKKIQKF